MVCLAELFCEGEGEGGVPVGSDSGVPGWGGESSFSEGSWIGSGSSFSVNILAREAMSASDNPARRNEAKIFSISFDERRSQDFFGVMWCMSPRSDCSATPVLVYLSGSFSRKSLRMSDVFPDPAIPTTTASVFLCSIHPDFRAWSTIA